MEQETTGNKTTAQAAAFAAEVAGAVESYRGLHIVRFDYGRSPSVAYWLGQQAAPTDIMHFLQPAIREEAIRQLKQARDRKLATGRWVSSITDTTFLPAGI